MNKGRKGSLRVEVVYALPAEQALLVLEVEDATTVGEVIQRSLIMDRFPGIGEIPGHVGIFGKRVALSATVRDGDRIEIYRPLTANPKEARRLRARLEPGRKSPARRK